MNKKVSFLLNGEPVSANNNETIWDVSKRNGKIIPHLCHSGKTGYKPDGNCRACMVEVDGERVLAASCVRKPTAGMVVNVNSKRAIKARNTVLELLVSDQPKRDIAHDQSSHLWQTASSQGIRDSRFSIFTI